VVGPAQVSVNYSWPMLMSGYFPCEVSWPSQPWTEGLVQDFSDDFRTRQLDAADGAENLVHNPNFEVDATLWAADSGETSLTRVTTDAAPGGGSACLEVTNTADTFGRVRSQSSDSTLGFPVTAGESLSGRGYFKPVSTSAGAFTTASLVFRFYDAAGAILATNSVAVQSTLVLGTWYEISGTLVVPALAVRAGIAMSTGTTVSATFVWRIDRLAAYRGSTVLAYLDGDIPTARWTGTRGASSSVELAESRLADYTTTVVPTSVNQGALELPSGFSSNIVHRAREPWQDGWVTVKGKGKTGAVSMDNMVTPGLRYTSDAEPFWWATLTNGNALRIYEGTTPTQRATVAAVLPAAGTDFWIRIRAEGTTVTAEYWTVRPTPTGTPTATCSYTNAATVRTGYPMLKAWGPAGSPTIPVLSEFDVRPYSYRLQNTPTTVSVETLPGTMDAQTDVDLSPSTSDTDVPRHALLGWRRKLTGRSPAVSGLPTAATSMLIPGESFSAFAGISSTTAVLATDATRYRGASNQAMTIPVLSTAGTSFIYAAIDPTLYEADDFADTVTCAVIVRYYRQANIVSPRLAVATIQGGVSFGYSPEFGSTGRYLPGATATARVTSTTLGTVTLQRLPQLSGLYLALSWAAGSTAAQVLAIDEVYLVPLSSLAMSPTDKGRDDGSYPAFVSGSSAYTVRVGSRGEGSRRQESAAEGANRYFTTAPLGIGGADIALPTASEGVELLVRPSASVPDDPVYTTTADILTHNVSVHLRVTPRYRFAA
jgi:hypothetical protein